MQYLSLDDWKIAARLPIPAGELMLSRLHNYGWIEIRGEKQHTAVKLTPAGREAMRSAIKITRRFVEPELKAKVNERNEQTSGISQKCRERHLEPMRKPLRSWPNPHKPIQLSQKIPPSKVPR